MSVHTNDFHLPSVKGTMPPCFFSLLQLGQWRWKFCKNMSAFLSCTRRLTLRGCAAERRGGRFNIMLLLYLSCSCHLGFLFMLRGTGLTKSSSCWWHFFMAFVNFLLIDHSALAIQVPMSLSAEGTKDSLGVWLENPECSSLLWTAGADLNSFCLLRTQSV